MFRLQNVLFPVDFSDRCRGAARLLDALHPYFPMQVTLAHVLPPPHLEYSMADVGGGVFQEYTKAREEQARNDLEYFLDEEMKHLQLKRILIEGDPARKLVEYATNHEMDMIVMPTHGYGGFRRFMLGSVTGKVLHDADIPVFTGVHMEDALEPEAVNLRKIAVALDLGENSEKVLKWASCFSKRAKAELKIFHVTPSIEGMSGEYFVPNWREKFEKEAHARVADLQQAADTNADVEFSSGEVPTEILQMAKGNATDLLIIGRHSSGGLLGRIRAHAYSIIRQSPCPVISV